MTKEEIVRRIDSLLRDTGYSRREFVEQGAAGTLAYPELRDLWLICGTDLAAEFAGSTQSG